MAGERSDDASVPVEHAAVVLRRTEAEPHGHRRRDWVVAAVVGVAGGAVVGLGITAATTGVLPGGSPGLELTRVEAGLGAAEGDVDRTVTVPADALAGLVPGDTRTFTLEVTNGAETSRSLRHSVSWEQAPGVPPFATEPDVELLGVPARVAAGQTVRLTVVVTAPLDWGVENQGTGASLVLELRASAS